MAENSFIFRVLVGTRQPHRASENSLPRFPCCQGTGSGPSDTPLLDLDLEVGTLFWFRVGAATATWQLCGEWGVEVPAAAAAVSGKYEKGGRAVGLPHFLLG